MKTADFRQQLELASKAKPTSNKLIRVFTDVLMSYSHKGLCELAANEKVDLNALNIGEFVCFINRPCTALKLYTAGNIIAYLRLPDGQKLDLRIITLLPRFFSGGNIRYQEGLKEVLNTNFKTIG